MASAPHASLSRIISATLMAGMVWTLGLLACFPAAHAWLHHTAACHDQTPAPATGADQEAACAVSLFAQGLTAPVLPPEAQAPELIFFALPPADPQAPVPKSSAYLHPPGQAPPQAS